MISSAFTQSMQFTMYTFPRPSPITKRLSPLFKTPQLVIGTELLFISRVSIFSSLFYEIGFKNTAYPVALHATTMPFFLSLHMLTIGVLS